MDARVNCDLPGKFAGRAHHVRGARAVHPRLRANAHLGRDAVAARLEDKGVQKFVKPFDQLMTTIRKKTATFAAGSASKPWWARLRFLRHGGSASLVWYPASAATCRGEAWLAPPA